MKASTSKLYFVCLRRPRANDSRTDPLYEFGSFGCTGCHSRNLLHLRHAADLAGARLAFAQGGHGEVRLVLLTPPITINVWATHCEATWRPVPMPFRFSDAPLLVANDGRTDFARIVPFLTATSRSTLQGAFASRFRSRATPLPADLARQIVAVYERRRKKRSAIAQHYVEALPLVTRVDRNRLKTFREHRARLLNEARALGLQVAARDSAVEVTADAGDVKSSRRCSVHRRAIDKKRCR